MTKRSFGDQTVGLRTTAACVATLALVAQVGTVTAARADETLAYSYAQAGAGSAAHVGSANQAQYVTNRDGLGAPGFDHNATVSASLAGYGDSLASAAPANSYLGLPQLRASAVGEAAAFNYGYALAYQAYTWNGANGIDLSVDTFIGHLDYSAVGAAGSSLILASLAIIDSSLRGSRAVRDAWGTSATRFGAFSATCSTPGAIGLATTGVLTTLGSVSATVSPTCGNATFHLDPGEEFFVQARLFVGHSGQGFTNALNTFAVEVSPDTPTDIRSALAQNLGRSSASLASVPEPATWAMLLMGFAGLGAVLRRGRARAPAQAAGFRTIGRRRS